MSAGEAKTLGELLGGAPAEFCGCCPTTPITHMAVDSRKVREGSVFVAIAGATHDGHAYLKQAQAAGAAVVVVTRGRCPAPDMPHVWLDDTAQHAPQMAANAYRHPGSSLRLAGVTGTNGKTTTTHLLAAMLTAGGRRFARLGTAGDWIVDHTRSSTFTTPFPLELQALLREVVERGGEDVVMEVSSHALAQGRVQPLLYQAVGLTSFSQDHLDFHGDMASYQQAKIQLAEHHLAASGVAVSVVDECPAGEAFLAAAAIVGAKTWAVSQRPESRAPLRISR
ncbi:MAG: Mur ligase family protein, partial [Nannocystaceae bacterium]